MWTPAWRGLRSTRHSSSAKKWLPDGPEPPLTLITFSIPRTPTRVRLTSVAGREAWTSGTEGERTGVVSLIWIVKQVSE